MALNPVTLVESLRPWRAAGLTHLLPLPDVPVAMPESVPEADLRVLSPKGGEVADRMEAREAAPPPAEGGRAVVDRWPAAWQALFARTIKAPLLWTYEELGADLSGRGDKARAERLRRMIGSLNLPRGTSTFWPVCLEEAETAPPGAAPGADSAAAKAVTPVVPTVAPTLAPDSGPPAFGGACFQEGLALLEPRAVIFMGPRALEIGAPELPLRIPYTQHILRGRLHILLPGFADMAADEGLMDRACLFLRTAVAGLPALFLGASAATPLFSK